MNDSSNSSGSQPATNDHFLASFPSLIATAAEVRSWLLLWFQANYLFLDPEGEPHISRFLQKVKLTGRDIRVLDKGGLYWYFRGKSEGFRHKALLESLAYDMQKAKGSLREQFQILL